jgi:hypothetical protein
MTTTISPTRLLALADSLGAQYEEWGNANDSDEADLIRAGATTTVARVVAYGSADAALIALLLPGANTALAALTTVMKNRATIWADLINALNTVDVLGVGGIDAYLTANAIRVGPNFAALVAVVAPQVTIGAANVDAGRVELP